MTNFPCPMCAAALVYQDGGATIYCPNCTNTVIVPASARQSADPFAAVGAPEMPPLPDWLDEVRARLSSDGKIMAIKLCRERAGLGLKEAKDAVDAIERGDTPEVAPFIPSGNMASVQAALRAGQKITASKPILEINPAHAVIEKLKASGDEDFGDWSSLLFDQSVLAEGGQLENPADFVKRMNTLMLKR